MKKYYIFLMLSLTNIDITLCQKLSTDGTIQNNGIYFTLNDFLNQQLSYGFNNNDHGHKLKKKK